MLPFLNSLLGALMIFGLPLRKIVQTSWAKKVLIPVGLTVETLDAGIHEKVIGTGISGTCGSGTTLLIISNKEVKDIMKVVKSLKDLSLLIKGVNQTTGNETKEQRGGFLGMLLGTLVARLLGNMLADKGVIRADNGVYRADRIFNSASSFD